MEEGEGKCQSRNGSGVRPSSRRLILVWLRLGITSCERNATVAGERRGMHLSLGKNSLHELAMGAMSSVTGMSGFVKSFLTATGRDV